MMGDAEYKKVTSALLYYRSTYSIAERALAERATVSTQALSGFERGKNVYMHLYTFHVTLTNVEPSCI